MVASTQHGTVKPWQPPLVDQARFVCALRLAMGEGFWMAVGSAATLIVREVIGFLRHRGDQKEKGVQWFVTVLQKELQDDRERLATAEKHIEELYEFNLALVDENRGLKEMLAEGREARVQLTERVEQVAEKVDALPAAPVVVEIVSGSEEDAR